MKSALRKNGVFFPLPFTAFLVVMGIFLLAPGFSHAIEKEEIKASSDKDLLSPDASTNTEQSMESTDMETLKKIPSVEEGEKTDFPFRITSDEFLDYDEESNFIYGRARTKVWYKDVYLEADRLIFDVRLNEIQAYGNILLRAKGDEYKADSLWYNLDKGRGYAYGASGRRKNIFIHSDPEEKQLPTFELLGQTEDNKPREALFRKSSYTTCDFPLPHYRIACKEILLYPDDRVFFRGATFYVWEVPVFYLPVYTRSLDESFPWSFIVGYDSKLGAYLRIDYDYHHAEYEPSIDDEDEWVKKSRGHLNAHVDFFGKRGIGYGALYKYSFDFNKHKGIIDLYRIADRKLDVVDYDDRYRIEDEDEYARWIAHIQHRSQITDEIYLQLDVDEMSDPDVYYDLLDRFNEIDRERIPERNVRAALTYRRDAFIGRLLFQMRSRIGRDRVTNFANPSDNDADLDIDPYRREIMDDYDGFPRDRYGRVSKRMPQLTFSSNYLQLFSVPLYTYTDINILNNLDRGLNIVSTEDDAWVRGIDVYQALLYRLRLARNYTLTARLGVGAAAFFRENDDYSYDFPPGAVFPYDQPWDEGGFTFLDEDTFIIGRRHPDTTQAQLDDWRKRNLDDVKDYYFYTDLMLRFYARFTDYLHGWIQYNIREGTDDSLGEFYESLGDVLARYDLYNFRLPEHWIRSGLVFFLRYPNLSTYLSGGYNLQGKKDIYANEELYFVSLGARYVNNPETFTFNTALRYSGRQEYDPSDPWEQKVDHIYGSMSAQYMPLSKRWWTKLSITGHKTLDDNDHYSNYRGFDEHDTEFNVRGILGGKLGPKYVVEGQVYYKDRLADNGISDIRLIIKRDLHDAIASLMVGMERDIREERYDDDEREGDLGFTSQFSLEFKSPYQQTPLGAPSIRTLADSAKKASIAEDQESIPLFAGD